MDLSSYSLGHIVNRERAAFVEGLTIDKGAELSTSARTALTPAQAASAGIEVHLTCLRLTDA